MLWNSGLEVWKASSHRIQAPGTSMLPAVSLRRYRSRSHSGELLGLGRLLHPRGCILGPPTNQGTRAVPAAPQEWPQQFERQREDNGGILIRGHVGESPEVAHLHRQG